MPAFVYGQSTVPATEGAFSEGEVALLDEIAETILPRTSTPGA
ncbi:Twin-arginine translocation pathway signal, partial [Pseudoxanthomonas broegbernensis]